MISRTLGIDEITGVETIHHYDELTQITHIEHRQDVEPIIERNKALQNTDHQRIGLKADFMHVATIPATIQMKWAKEHGITDIYSREFMPIIVRLLKDPEYRHLNVGSLRA